MLPSLIILMEQWSSLPRTAHGWCLSTTNHVLGSAQGHVRLHEMKSDPTRSLLIEILVISFPSLSKFMLPRWIPSSRHPKYRQSEVALAKGWPLFGVDGPTFLCKDAPLTMNHGKANPTLQENPPLAPSQPLAPRETNESPSNPSQTCQKSHSEFLTWHWSGSRAFMRRQMLIPLPQAVSRSTGSPWRLRRFSSWYPVLPISMEIAAWPMFSAEGCTNKLTFSLLELSFFPAVKLPQAHVLGYLR